MRRPSRRVAAVAAAAACLLAGGVVTVARAVEPIRPSAAPEPADSLSLPPPPPGVGWTPFGLTVDHSVQSVKRAKLAINLQPFRAFTWAQALPEPPDGSGTSWLDATADIFVTTPGGPADQFGQFAPVTVHALAFGTIPVTATVHISQTRTNSGIVPLEVKIRFTGNKLQPPEPLPCSPPAWPTLQCRYTEAPQMTGKVDIRVDNVTIDQVPVDVGPNCHTVSPATMSLTADAGYYSYPDPDYIPAGLYVPFVAGGTLHGPVDVPAFTGCRNGADDLSPIVTAMVSGPDNELQTHQDGPLTNYPPPEPSAK